jgi:hypothetical protein
MWSASLPKTARLEDTATPLTGGRDNGSEYDSDYAVLGERVPCCSWGDEHHVWVGRPGTVAITEAANPPSTTMFCPVT